MARTIISQTELAKKTQEVVDRVQHGELTIIESSGHEQAVLFWTPAMPAWKKPPQTRLSLNSLSLGDEVLADRDKTR